MTFPVAGWAGADIIASKRSTSNAPPAADLTAADPEPYGERILAVLFDLDGTLVDSFGAIADSVNHVRGRYGLEPLDRADVARFVGNGASRLLELTVPMGAPADNLKAYLEHHPSVIAGHTELLPGVAETLRTLRSRGIKMGVCSNKPLAMTRIVLECVGLKEFFDVVLGPESVPRRKPAPDMLLEAVRMLGIKASDALYVGDMSVDVETARAAGMPCWALATGTQGRSELLAGGANRVLNSMSELTQQPEIAASLGRVANSVAGR